MPDYSENKNTSIDTLLDTLLNELNLNKQTIAIVLDDYHVLREDSIHKSLSYFLDYLPSHIHLFISSRSAIPFSTAKRNVSGESNHIDAEELQFTLDEISSFYKGKSQLTLSPTHLEQLNQCTEGWVAGLQLVSISLRNTTNYDQLIEEFSGSHRNVAEYLFNEVFINLSDDVQSFRLQTSLLKLMDASICNKLT